MNKFKYRFNALTYILIAAGIAIACLSVYLNVVRFIALVGESEVVSAYSYITVALVLLMSCVFIVLMVAMLCCSAYEVNDKNLTIRFGVIKSTYKLSEIAVAQKFVDEKKLAVYFRDGSYTMVVIKEELFGEFISALISRNKKIEFVEKFEDPEE